LKNDPVETDAGATGSPQGTEFQQGLTSRSALLGTVTLGRLFEEPQQQDAPLHFEAHRHSFAWASASNVGLAVMLDP
jgi:hypothetical protein